MTAEADSNDSRPDATTWAFSRSIVAHGRRWRTVSDTLAEPGSQRVTMTRCGGDLYRASGAVELLRRARRADRRPALGSARHRCVHPEPPPSRGCLRRRRRALGLARP